MGKHGGILVVLGGSSGSVSIVYFGSVCVCVCVCTCAGVRKRERDRQTDRYTERETK